MVVSRQLSVVALGHVHTEAFEPLTAHLARLEQVVTNLESHASLDRHRAELTRAIDAAANDWILILREREMIDDALAASIAESLNGTAWGYRIRVEHMYVGAPLRIGDEEGELRLFHRRHLLRREMAVEGPVVRSTNPLRTITFASTQEHRDYLKKRSRPRSALRRIVSFLGNARTFDLTTLRYVWIEAGFDAGEGNKADS